MSNTLLKIHSGISVIRQVSDGCKYPTYYPFPNHNSKGILEVYLLDSCRDNLMKLLNKHGLNRSMKPVSLSENGFNELTITDEFPEECVNELMEIWRRL